MKHRLVVPVWRDATFVFPSLIQCDEIHLQFCMKAEFLQPTHVNISKHPDFMQSFPANLQSSVEGKDAALTQEGAGISVVI